MSIKVNKVRFQSGYLSKRSQEGLKRRQIAYMHNYHFLRETYYVFKENNRLILKDKM